MVVHLINSLGVLLSLLTGSFDPPRCFFYVSFSSMPFLFFVWPPRKDFPFWHTATIIITTKTKTTSRWIVYTVSLSTINHKRLTARTAIAHIRTDRWTGPTFSPKLYNYITAIAHTQTDGTCRHSPHKD